MGILIAPCSRRSGRPSSLRCVPDAYETPSAAQAIQEGLRSALYIGIERKQHETYSVLRTLPLSAEPTKYASALVRMVGGMLISSTAPDGLNAMHLFLPLDPAR